MKHNGFSLIELVIIMILLGILAAVAIPRFWDLINPSKEKITRHRMEELRKSIVGNPDMTGAGTASARGFRGDVGQWPNQLSDLALSSAAGQVQYGSWNRYTRRGYNGPYVDSSSQYAVDAWGANFIYSSAGTPTITSYGADGSLGGTGINADITVELRY